eukprot:Em0015g1189a
MEPLLFLVFCRQRAAVVSLLYDSPLGALFVPYTCRFGILWTSMWDCGVWPHYEQTFTSFTKTLALLLPFLVSAGGVLNKIGNDGLNRSTQVYFLAQFAGAGWAVTTLWISLLFWPFHEGKKRGQYEPLN